MLKIDGELLRRELLLDNHTISIIDIDDEIVLEDEDILLVLRTILQTYLNDKQLGSVSVIKNQDDLFKYISNYFFTQLVNDEDDEKIALISLLISTTLFLSKVSNSAMELLSSGLKHIEDIQRYHSELEPYIKSEDYRAILFWLGEKHSRLNYDNLNKNQITYEYAPPKITPQWLENYRKYEQPMEFWFYNSAVGKALFLILYTPKCRYAKCSGCNLPSLSSQETSTSPSEVYKQVDYVLQESISDEEKSSLKEMILSNNGNLFDIKTMPTLSLLYTINTLIEELPNLQKIIIESRIEYLNEHQLQTIQEVLSAHEDRDIQIEIALGFEIFDDEIRNGYYKKGFHKSHLEKLMPLFSKYNISLKWYMMYKAVPQMSTEDAIVDINNVSNYAHELIKKYAVDINLHISPTYVAVGTLLEKEFNEGNYTPPGPKEIDQLCNELASFSNVSYYISLNDEGLSATHIEDEYKSFLDLKTKVDYFNSYQKWA